MHHKASLKEINCMEIGYFCQMASLSMQILMRLLDMSHDMNEYVQRLFGQNILIAVCSCRALALLCQMLALMWVLNMAVLLYIGNETGKSRSVSVRFSRRCHWL